MFSKKNRILCYLLTLLPAVLGIAVKRLLPGVEDSGFMWPVYMPLGMVVFEMLLFRLMDSMGENREKNRKINGVVMWIFPVLCNVLFLMSFALSTGVRFSPGKVVSWLLGVLFLVIGNYLPKCRQNSTVGIRIPWTFASEANWNATHRMAGPIWMAAGLVMLIGSFFREEVMVVVMFATIAIAVLAPVIYSCGYYLRQKREGQTLTTRVKNPRLSRAGALMLVAVLGFAAVMMFTGSVRVDFREEGLEVKVTYYGQAVVPYGSIERAELRQENVDGMRQFGLGSLRLLAGSFQNSEFGDYTRYTYYDPDSAIVLTMRDGSTVVLSGKDPAQTEEIYQELLKRMGS